MTPSCIPIYEFSLNLRVGWESHSLSNVGSNGTNRLQGRRIRLTDGVEADAASGNNQKRYHAVITTEYLRVTGEPLCACCAVGDGRRAGGLSAVELSKGHPVAQCGVCDIHGYLITKRIGEKESGDESLEHIESTGTRSDHATSETKRKTKSKADPVESPKHDSQARQSRSSLVEFSFAIGDPAHHGESRQLFTRVGDGRESGQMLMTKPNRSGVYFSNARYKAAGIGTDTNTWLRVVQDEAQRRVRHKAVLSAYRDQVLSPGGAQTATMLPHVTSLVGAICVRHQIGRAPIYSARDPRFVERLQTLSHSDLSMYTFDSIETFAEIMENLIANSVPTEIRKRAIQ